MRFSQDSSVFCHTQVGMIDASFDTVDISIAWLGTTIAEVLEFQAKSDRYGR